MERTKPVVTFGADPEFFVLGKSGQLIPSFELDITGRKGVPAALPGLSGVGVLCDGVAVELNTPEELRLGRVIKKLRLAVDNMALHYAPLVSKGGRISDCDYVEVQKKYHDNPLFSEIGCDPDLDAYSETGERPPCKAEEMGSTRFAGGHIHVGCTPWPEYLPKNVFVQFLDILYARASGGFSVSPRSDFYGKPGLWRDKDYGVEYRSPDFSWRNWGPSEVGIVESPIFQLLGPKSPKTEDNLFHIYNSGEISEFIESYKRNPKSPKHYDASVRSSYDAIARAFSGHRMIIVPRPSSLPGYTREVEDGVRIPVIVQNEAEVGRRDDVLRARPRFDDEPRAGNGHIWVVGRIGDETTDVPGTMLREFDEEAEANEEDPPETLVFCGILHNFRMNLFDEASSYLLYINTDGTRFGVCRRQNPHEVLFLKDMADPASAELYHLLLPLGRFGWELEVRGQNIDPPPGIAGRFYNRNGWEVFRLIQMNVVDDPAPDRPVQGQRVGDAIVDEAAPVDAQAWGAANGGVAFRDWLDNVAVRRR